MENMDLNKDFWKGKKVFLTGHTGFKGAWLSIWLQSMGAHIAGYALPPSTQPNLFSLLNLGADMQSVFGDIRDLNNLKDNIRSFNPDIVIHMAAQAIVRESYQNPVETFEVNAIGTVHLLESVRYTSNTKAVVCVTSDKCYDNKEWPWKYRESDSMGGRDPYSASKGCSELIISSYRNSYFNQEQFSKHGVAVASVRAVNVVGGGDWGRDRLIPDIMRAFSENEKVIIRNPSATRPWQYILDLLSGYLLLTERLFEKGPEYTEAWNFGPSDNDEKTVLDIVKIISRLWGNGGDWGLDGKANSHPHEAFTLTLDSSKSRNRLGWTPKLSLDQSLEFIVDWYRKYYSNSSANISMREFTEKQISKFEEHQPNVSNSMMTSS